MSKSSFILNNILKGDDVHEAFGLEEAGRSADQRRVDALDDVAEKLDYLADRIEKIVRGTSAERQARAYIVPWLRTWAGTGDSSAVRHQTGNIPALKRIITGEDR